MKIKLSEDSWHDTKLSQQVLPKLRIKSKDEFAFPSNSLFYDSIIKAINGIGKKLVRKKIHN